MEDNDQDTIMVKYHHTNLVWFGLHPKLRLHLHSARNVPQQQGKFNLSPMQARENAGCAKSRPGTHPSLIRETKDRPDSNGSVGSLVDLGQKKTQKKIQPPSISMTMGKMGRVKRKEKTHTKKKKKKIPKPKGDPPGPLESAWPSVSLI
jgi:hypothetical protein